MTGPPAREPGAIRGACSRPSAAVSGPVPNLFADLPSDRPDELVQILAAAPGVRIERIVSHGHASPPGFWYDQPQHEWVVLLTGAATVRFADGTVEMRPGDHITIPAHTKHRVEWTTPDGPTVWLAVFYDRARASDAS